jgi:hypothetical protein
VERTLGAAEWDGILHAVLASSKTGILHGFADGPHVSP